MSIQVTKEKINIREQITTLQAKSDFKTIADNLGQYQDTLSIGDTLLVKSDDTLQFNTQKITHGDVIVKRQQFKINANGDTTTDKRRVQLALSNYVGVRVRLAAQRTNAGNCLAFWEGYVNNNDDTPYSYQIATKTGSGTISYTFSTQYTNGLSLFNWDFNDHGSPGDGTITLESVRGDASIIITNW
jgi:hypothetical protein